MKLILHVFFWLVLGGVAWSQTNTEVADQELPVEPVAELETLTLEPDDSLAEVEDLERGGAEQESTHIYSDTVELGIKTRTATYRGNVRLDDPRIQLTCEQLSAEVPEEGGRVDRVVAETNVVILMFDDDGSTNRAYADKAVYSYSATASGTNETVELSGDPQPRIERPEGTLYGDVIIWDRAGNQIRATNQRMIYRAESEALTNILSQSSATEQPREQPAAIESTTDDSASSPQSESLTDE
jgi:lipopolysaccharide export system protein LptA